MMLAVGGFFNLKNVEVILFKYSSMFAGYRFDYKKTFKANKKFITITGPKFLLIP